MQRRPYGRKVLGIALLALLVTASAFATTMAVTKPPPSARPSSEVQLTDGLASHVEPRFSPDGRQIAYSSNQSGSFRIWTMSSDGRKQTEVTSLPGDQVMPGWSPDGSRIAFIWKHGSFSDLCIVSVSVDEQECATKGASVQNFAWSPMGDVIAYDAGNGIIRLFNTTSGSDVVFPFASPVRDPDFGPSPSTLYFSGQTGQGDYIWRANTDGRDPERLSQTGSDVEPQVSPSGDRVIYLTNLSGRYEPWLIDLVSGTSVYLFNFPHVSFYTIPEGPHLASDTFPSWGPNGTNILLISSMNGSRGRLYLVTLNFPVKLTLPPLPQGTTSVLNVFNMVPLAGPACDVQWSPRGDVVVETAISGSTQLFLLQNGPPVKVGYGG